MKQLFIRRSLTAFAILAVASLSQTTSQAFIWNEIGDAGGIASAAQAVSGTGQLTSINGSFLTGNDFDVYRFSITNPALFSATTSSISDTFISLFRLSGVGIAFNDDIGGGNFNSRLPAGNALYASLIPGDYLLGISEYNNMAATDGLVPIFDDPQPFTGITGPVGSGIFAAQTGYGPVSTTRVAYSIALSGAAGGIPEPGTWATGAGLLAAVSARLLCRRRV